MSRAEAPLPSLPLWLAVLIALSAESAGLAGLAHWPVRRDTTPPEVPIEVSLVSAAAVAESAADEPPPAAEEPEPPPEPKPEPAPPPSVKALDPKAVPVALVHPKPKPKPRPKAKPVKPPKPKASPPPRAAPPKVPSRSVSRGGAGMATEPTVPARAGKGAGSGRAVAGAKGASGTGGSSPAAYLSNPAPGYPDAARRQRQEGTVSLRVLVSASGEASQVVLAGSSGVSSLDQAALRAVRRWRFKPARQNGQPIRAWVRVPVRFKLSR